MTPHRSFVEKVRLGMQRRGLTLRSFCRAVPLDPSFFSKVLSGKRSPPSEEAVVRRIAQVLEIPAPELIVAAGRIPSEWGRLTANPALFGDVHRLASSMPATPPPSRPVQADVPLSVPRAAPGGRRDVWGSRDGDPGVPVPPFVRKELATELL